MQNVPPALLVRFLREHRSEWADYGVDAYSAACLKAGPYAVPCARPGGFPSSQVILPLAHTVEHEEVMNTLDSVCSFYVHKNKYTNLKLCHLYTLCSCWRWFGWRAMHSHQKMWLWQGICTYCRSFYYCCI